MPTRHIIGLVLVATIVLSLVYIIYRFMRKPSKKFKRKKGARESDQRRLNRYENKAYAQAVELHKQGKSIPAAQLLESIGMMRECINVLESSGHIKEAAGTLLRMQKPNRAGVILARHKKWFDAAQCFLTAGLPLEAAKCFKEVAEWDKAAENFQKAQRFEDAAECYSSAGEYGRAAKIFAKLNTKDKYLEAMRMMHQDGHTIGGHHFDSNQVEIIKEILVDPAQTFHEFLLPAFATGEEQAELILALLDSERTEEASRALRLFGESPCDDLLIGVNYVKPSAPMLGEIFMENEKFSRAASVYTRLELHEKAGQAFELEGDYHSAITSYEKSGEKDKVKELKKKIRKEKNIPKKSSSNFTPLNDAQNPFSLKGFDETGGGNSSINNGFEGLNSEQTIILDNEESTSANAFEVNKFEGDDDDPKMVFQRVEFLDELARSEKDKVWSIGNLRKFNADQVILDYGEEPEGVYFVLRGEVSIEIKSQGQSVPYKTLGTRDSFGESWVLGDQDSEFLARASSDCELFIVSKEELLELMDEEGLITRKLYKKYTQQLMARLVSSQNNSQNMKAS